MKEYITNPDPHQLYRMGHYTFMYDRESGKYHIKVDNRTKIEDAFASAAVGGILYRSVDYVQHEVKSMPIQDDFGVGLMLCVISKKPGCPILEQRFYLYEDQHYLLTSLRVYWDNGETIATNYIAPLNVNTPGSVRIKNETAGQNVFLRVPYDNDTWVEFELNSINGSDTGYEAAAIFDEVTGNAIVLGSLSHDIWKTGISYAGRQNQLEELRVYGGANSALTRDQSPHGTVTGRQVSSPLMFIGLYENWQDGMDAYALANTKVVPPKKNAVSVPFGWNSWGSVQSGLNFEIATGISDYIHNNFQHVWKTGKNDVVYTNLDAFWNNLTNDELIEFVQHCKRNGQEAGIYWAPFACWHSQAQLAERTVEGTDGVLYQDIILKKADGSYYGNDLDGAFPVDITHPAAQARVNYYIDKLKSAGFAYIKLDFLAHGALEGSRYDPSIQTGTQAYNFGMRYVTDRLDGQMFINLSIAPTFPYQYANGKRIACDAFYSIANTEYTLNALTYGFWQKHLYQYPDPDHLLVWGQDGGASLEEARSRVTSGILLGTSFLAGDNFVNPCGDQAAADARFKKLFTNPDIIAVAKTGKIFHPLAVKRLKTAANMFTMTDENAFYLAVINYNSDIFSSSTNLNEMLGLTKDVPVKELWSGEELKLQNGALTINIAGRDSKVYRVIRNAVG